MIHYKSKKKAFKQTFRNRIQKLLNNKFDKCIMYLCREEYLNKLIALRDENIIKIVTGIRRCGKSTLFEIFQDYLINNGGIDHCYDPRYPYDNTVRSSSITFGNNIGAYYGYDYWGSISFDKVEEFLKRGVIIL